MKTSEKHERERERLILLTQFVIYYIREESIMKATAALAKAEGPPGEQPRVPQHQVQAAPAKLEDSKQAMKNK
jgi:hypothetical protein